MLELVASRRSVDTQGMKTVSKTNDEQRIELETGGLCLRFARVGDRFQLRLLVDGATLLDAAELREAAGGAHDAWPTAPPLQQLHEQVLPAGPVVLGVGSAGTTHWSASFAVQEPGVIWCEYAARVSRTWEPASQWLGSSFLISDGWKWSTAENELTLANTTRKIHLKTLGTESQLAVNDSGRVEIAPAKDFVQRSNTIQWRLAIRLG